MVVRTLDPENITSRPQVANRDLMAAADLDPIIVQPVDLVGILVAPGVGIGEGGEGERDDRDTGMAGFEKKNTAHLPAPDR